MREYHRTATIIAGVYTLIQAVVYAVVAIYVSAIYACMTVFPWPLNNNYVVSTLLYDAYFKGKCRADFGTQMVESGATTRTYHFMLVYGVASSVWIPVSVLLLIGAINNSRGRCGAFLYYPWIVTTAVMLTIDIISTVVYGIDISKTSTVQDFATFCGVSTLDLPSNSEGQTVWPSVIMTSLFSRMIVFWILNFIFLGIVTQAAIAIQKFAVTTSRFIQNGPSLNKSDPMDARWVNVRKSPPPSVQLPRLQEDNLRPRARSSTPVERPPSSRSMDHSMCPQSPLQETLPNLIQRRLHSPDRIEPLVFIERPPLTRSDSSPVFDVHGKPTDFTFPFSHDPNLRYTTGNNERERDRERDRDSLSSDVNPQMPFAYIKPGDLAIKMHQRPNIPNPDYTVSRANSQVQQRPQSYDKTYSDQRWNPKRAY